ncbi:unnamed protein product, partial [Hapterophycus canaliculatus]
RVWTGTWTGGQSGRYLALARSSRRGRVGCDDKRWACFFRFPLIPPVASAAYRVRDDPEVSASIRLSGPRHRHHTSKPPVMQPLQALALKSHYEMRKDCCGEEQCL